MMEFKEKSEQIEEIKLKDIKTLGELIELLKEHKIESETESKGRLAYLRGED